MGRRAVMKCSEPIQSPLDTTLLRAFIAQRPSMPKHCLGFPVLQGGIELEEAIPVPEVPAFKCLAVNLEKHIPLKTQRRTYPLSQEDPNARARRPNLKRLPAKIRSHTQTRKFQVLEDNMTSSPMLDTYSGAGEHWRPGSGKSSADKSALPSHRLEKPKRPTRQAPAASASPLPISSNHSSAPPQAGNTTKVTLRSQSHLHSAPPTHISPQTWEFPEVETYDSRRSDCKEVEHGYPSDRLEW